MKDLFPQFSGSSEWNYNLVWNHALFVFDTNVLLNLYRYQSATRDELLNVLRRLAERIWIPHHVALEFQRNRLKVIAEQNNRFADVRRTIEKAQAGLVTDLEKLQLNRRHSLIDPQPLILGFEKLVADFLTDLDGLHATQQKLSGPDPLKAQIENLFDGRVGREPEDQASIDELYKQAEERFKLRIPPGYQDADKDKDTSDEHVCGGIIYKRKFGDFLVWQQLLSYAKSAGSKAVIFVTDDGKEDWWWKIDSNGSKTIGPRPELVEEAKRQGGLDSLLMYNPEGFLKYAKEFLKAPVSEETLKEVRDVSTTRALHGVGIGGFGETMRAVQAVRIWLEGRFDKVQENRNGFPDFIAEKDGRNFGFEIKVIPQLRYIPQRIRDVVYRAYYELNEGQYSEITIVWVVENLARSEELKRVLSREKQDGMPDSLRMIIGSINDPEASDGAFQPYEACIYNQISPFG